MPLLIKKGEIESMSRVSPITHSQTDFDSYRATQLLRSRSGALLREAFKNVLTDNHFAKKPLADRGGYTPPFMDNPQST